MTTTLLADAVRQHGSPLWAYDAQTIHQRIDQLKQHFDTVRFAQKANPNLHVLRLIRERGLVLDAVSLGKWNAPSPLAHRWAASRLAWC